MAYKIGDFIAASHYNGFITTVNPMYGEGTGNLGYGQTPLASVEVDAPVRASEWRGLRNAIDDSSTHQGLDVSAIAGAQIPASGEFDIGDVIFAYSGEIGRWNLPLNANAIVTNRLTVSGSQAVLTASVVSSKRETSWASQLVHEIEVNFSSVTEARHFFNLGGELRFSGDRQGGTVNPQNTAWTNLFASNSYTFGATDYFSGPSISYIQRFSVASASAYSLSDWTIKEKRDEINGCNGSHGKQITFRVEYNDDHVSGFDDLVDGSIVSVMDRLTSVGVLPATNPSASSLVELTSGN